MNATQQHMFDAYRAAQRGEPAPPLPTTGTVRAAREIQQWRRFQAVVTDPADRFPARARRAVRALAARLRRQAHISRTDQAAADRFSGVQLQPEGRQAEVRSQPEVGRQAEAGRRPDAQLRARV